MAALESSEAEPSARDKAASPVKKSGEKRTEAKKAFMEKTGKDISDESEVAFSEISGGFEESVDASGDQALPKSPEKKKATPPQAPAKAAEIKK
jgi:hypothetical protein